MNTRVRIPREAAKAVDALADIGALVSAKEWHRAAIVAALVGPPTGKGNASSGILSPLDLASKGIVGLRSHTTIERYRDYWVRQRPVPDLGDTVDLDDLPSWPGVPDEDLAQHTGMTPERKAALQQAGRDAGMPTGAKVVDVAANPKALKAAIESDPETFRVAREAVEHTEFVEAVRSVGGNAHQGSVPDPEPRWHRLTRRISMDVLEIKTEIGQMRADGNHNTADLALSDLRAVLAQAVSELEEVPDTIEGIDR